MRIGLAICCVLLSSCAATVLQPEQAQKMSVVELCAGTLTFGPLSTKVAEAEVTRRGIDCSQHQQAVAAKIGADSAPRAAGYVPPNPVRTCNSYRIGNQVQTQCY